MKIKLYPDSVLRKKAKRVFCFDLSLRKLADEMFKTMYENAGVGLAANQIGKLKRVIVVIDNGKPNVLINPEIIDKEGFEYELEGCLSFPDLFINIKRASRVVVQYQDLYGIKQLLGAEGRLARTIQHEIDHLDGKLFIDYKIK